jgi:PPOX class probable F420-dependent enzyme
VVSLPPGVADFIASGRVGRLGTADAAGQPHVVPFCYAWDGTALFSAIDAKPKRAAPRALRRIRNIEANPHVSVVIDEYDEDWSRLRWVQIQGRAEVLLDGREYTRGVDLLCAKYAQYRAMGLDRTAGVVIKITPSHVSSWSGVAR